VVIYPSKWWFSIAYKNSDEWSNIIGRAAAQLQSGQGRKNLAYFLQYDDIEKK